MGDERKTMIDTYEAWEDLLYFEWGEISAHFHVMKIPHGHLYRTIESSASGESVALVFVRDDTIE